MSISMENARFCNSIMDIKVFGRIFNVQYFLLVDGKNN